MVNRIKWTNALLAISTMSLLGAQNSKAELEDFFTPACEPRENARTLFEQGKVSGTNGSVAVQQQAMAACNQRAQSSTYVTECSTSCSNNPFVKNKNNSTVTCDWFLHRISEYRFAPKYTSDPEVVIADYSAGAVPVELPDGSLLVSNQGSSEKFFIYSKDGKKLRSLDFKKPVAFGVNSTKVIPINKNRYAIWANETTTPQKNNRALLAFFNENGEMIGNLKTFNEVAFRFIIDSAISSDRKQIAFLFESENNVPGIGNFVAPVGLVVFDENGNQRKKVNLSEQFPHVISYNAQVFFGSTGEYWITAFDGSLLAYATQTDEFRSIPFLSSTIQSFGFNRFGFSYPAYGYNGVPNMSGLKAQSASAALQVQSFELRDNKRIGEQIHWIDANDRTTTLDLMNPIQNGSLGTNDKSGFDGRVYAKLDRFGKLESVTYGLAQVLSNAEDNPGRTVNHYYQDGKIASESSFVGVWTPQASELFDAGFRAQLLVQDRYYFVNGKSYCVDAQRKPSSNCVQLSISDLSGKQQWNIPISDVTPDTLQLRNYRLYPIGKDEFSVTYLGRVKGPVVQNGQLLKKFKLSKDCAYVQLLK